MLGGISPRSYLIVAKSSSVQTPDAKQSAIFLFIATLMSPLAALGSSNSTSVPVPVLIVIGHRKDKPPSLVMFTTLDWVGLGKIGEFPDLDRGRVAWRSAPDTS